MFVERKYVHIPAPMSWYANDYGPTKEAVVAFISQNVSDEKRAKLIALLQARPLYKCVIVDKYDWTFEYDVVE